MLSKFIIFSRCKITEKLWNFQIFYPIINNNNIKID